VVFSKIPPALTSAFHFSLFILELRVSRAPRNGAHAIGRREARHIWSTLQTALTLGLIHTAALAGWLGASVWCIYAACRHPVIRRTVTGLQYDHTPISRSFSQNTLPTIFLGRSRATPLYCSQTIPPERFLSIHYNCYGPYHTRLLPSSCPLHSLSSLSRVIIFYIAARVTPILLTPLPLPDLWIKSIILHRFAELSPLCIPTLRLYASRVMCKVK